MRHVINFLIFVGLLEFNIMHYVLRLFISVFLGGIMVLGNAQTQIAFISDAHIQNVDGHPERVRSMEVQVQSTRLFNENYYAFLAALDDVARRNIRWVVLPGDLTDDGQFFNQQKIKELLNSYAAAKGMRFFVTTGNHDPALPLGMRQKNVHFLSADGSRVTREDSCAGYVSQMECYADFGFSLGRTTVIGKVLLLLIRMTSILTRMLAVKVYWASGPTHCAIR